MRCGPQLADLAARESLDDVVECDLLHAVKRRLLRQRQQAFIWPRSPCRYAIAVRIGVVTWKPETGRRIHELRHRDYGAGNVPIKEPPVIVPSRRNTRRGDAQRQQRLRGRRSFDNRQRRSPQHLDNHRRRRSRMAAHRLPQAWPLRPPGMRADHGGRSRSVCTSGAHRSSSASTGHQPSSA